MRIPKTADAWVQAMKQSKKGNQILQNLREEENVPANTAKRFFKELAAKYTAGDDPIKHFRMTRKTNSGLSPHGPEANLGVIALLNRFSKLRGLTETPELRKAGISFKRLKADPKLADKIQVLPLGEKSGIVWTALLEPIDNDIKKGAKLVEVIDKLGLPDKITEPWYQVIYNTNDVDDECRVPTVLDPGANMYFRPAPKDADHGMTHPCSGNGQGYPECVHGKCFLSNPTIRHHVA